MAIPVRHAVTSLDSINKTSLYVKNVNSMKNYISKTEKLDEETINKYLKIQDFVYTHVKLLSNNSILGVFVTAVMYQKNNSNEMIQRFKNVIVDDYLFIKDLDMNYGLESEVVIGQYQLFLKKIINSSGTQFVIFITNRLAPSTEDLKVTYFEDMINEFFKQVPVYQYMYINSVGKNVLDTKNYGLINQQNDNFELKSTVKLERHIYFKNSEEDSYLSVLCLKNSNMNNPNTVIVSQGGDYNNKKIECRYSVLYTDVRFLVLISNSNFIELLESVNKEILDLVRVVYTKVYAFPFFSQYGINIKKERRLTVEKENQSGPSQGIIVNPTPTFIQFKNMFYERYYILSDKILPLVLGYCKIEGVLHKLNFHIQIEEKRNEMDKSVFKFRGFDMQTISLCVFYIHELPSKESVDVALIKACLLHSIIRNISWINNSRYYSRNIVNITKEIDRMGIFLYNNQVWLGWDTGTDNALISWNERYRKLMDYKKKRDASYLDMDNVDSGDQKQIDYSIKTQCGEYL